MAESSSDMRKPLLGDRSYTALKQAATIILPALGALYFALAQTWGLPKAEEVIGTIAAANTFLGVLVGVSTRSYNKSDSKYAGAIVVDDTGEKKMFSLELNEAPENIEKKHEVTFKVSDTGNTPTIRQ